jgi:phage baseplate assembly protein W
MAKGINIKFPFKETIKGGVFDVNKTTDEALKDDLISLLTTKRGHRVMRGNLYSPVYDYLMEPLDDFSQKQLKLEIEEKVEEFIPQIIIENVTFSEDTEDVDRNFLSIKIFFTIKNFFEIKDSITLNIPRDNNIET